MIDIVTSPDLPKTMAETICATADEAGRMSLQILSYLRTGNIDHLRIATNSLLRLHSMGTKSFLNALIVRSMRGEHPLTDEERKELYAQLLTTADEELPA